MLGAGLRVPVVLFIELFRGLPGRHHHRLRLARHGRARHRRRRPLPGEPALWYLVIGLTLYNSVIIAEILRAGVASLPRGQREAALAVGLTPWPDDAYDPAAPGVPGHAAGPDQPARGGRSRTPRWSPSSAWATSSCCGRGNQISQNLDNPIQTLFDRRADLHRHQLLAVQARRVPRAAPGPGERLVGERRAHAARRDPGRLIPQRPGADRALPCSATKCPVAT